MKFEVPQKQIQQPEGKTSTQQLEINTSVSYIIIFNSLFSQSLTYPEMSEEKITDKAKKSNLQDISDDVRYFTHNS